ncbi:hypothetical protein [Mechercharimyces sp. CAU 1602]|uniref:hypothetical protein n=1 Tax=Mechercharimyces sp. CAU 1602 TaxID=2973933 RepID=UPI002163D3B0|nr:hypothetical protein [Mechercharimyces sp. CAU 1602]MCS1350352.1 hypothetical protein [Mechercharimyces sp. CAU 1602]
MTSLNVNVKISNHAVKRVQAYYFRRPYKEAKNFIKNLITDARFIAEIIGGKGEEGLLYANGKYSIITTRDGSLIKTVYRVEKLKHKGTEEKIRELVAKEERKYARTIKATIRKTEREKLEWGLYIAELRIQQYETKSDTKKNAIEAHIRGIEKYLVQVEGDIKAMQDEHRQISKSLVFMG